jgi:hypothetical protein
MLTFALLLSFYVSETATRICTPSPAVAKEWLGYISLSFSQIRSNVPFVTRPRHEQSRLFWHRSSP